MNSEPTDVADKKGAGTFFGSDISAGAFKKALVFLLLLGLVVRTGFLVEHAHSPFFGVPILDEKYYVMVARMLLAGQDLHELHGFRPLLYPMYLAAAFKFGGKWGADAAIIGQHTLGVATGIFVALIAARVFRHRVSGIAAGALYLLAPVPLFFEGELLIESSYVFLIVFGLWLALVAAEEVGWRCALLWTVSGGLTVIASQERANILVFLAVYPLFGAMRWLRERNTISLTPLFGLAGALVMMVPWGFINMRQSDHFHLMPNAGGVNLYLGNKRGANGLFTGEDVVAKLSELNKSEAANPAPPQFRIASGARYQDLVEVWARAEYSSAMLAQGLEPQDDPMAISEYWTRQTVLEIRADPPAWLKLMAKKCWLMLWNVEVPNNKSFAFFQTEFSWLRLLPVRWVLLLMLAPAGIWVALKWCDRNAVFIVLAFATLYSAADVAFFICDRYRYPVWPAMAVLAGGGLTGLIEMLRQRKSRQAVCFFAVMAFMAALSLHNWFGAKVPNFAHDYQFRSIAYYDRGKYPQALEDVDHSLALDGLDPAAMYQRGNVLFALNRLEEAKTAYEGTLKLLPGDSGVWNNLGATLDALGRPEEAVQAFRHATECSLPSETAFLGLAFLQIRQGQLDAAEATLGQLEKLQSGETAAATAARSVIKRKRGNVAQADALEKQARAIDAEKAGWAIERAMK